MQEENLCQSQVTGMANHRNCSWIVGTQAKRSEVECPNVRMLSNTAMMRITKSTYKTSHDQVNGALESQ